MNNNLNCTCICIENVGCTKYLGLYLLYSHSKWKNHIKYLVSLSCKFFYIFRNLRSILDKILLRIIYISLVQSTISYRIEIWDCANDIHLKILKTTINKKIQFILKLPNYTCSDIIYQDLNIFNFKKLLKKMYYYL